VEVMRKPSDGGAVITLELDGELDLPGPPLAFSHKVLS
jgi:hypothetical protein